MQDRVPTYPGRVELIPVLGQENTYEMVRADEPTQEGTPLNKANLLQDSVAKMYGLLESAIPNDVFAFLGKYNLHWWRRRINTTGTIGEWEYLFSADSNAHPKSGIVSGYEYEYIGIPYKNFTSPPIQVAYGKYTGTGTWGESSPNKLTFSFAPKVVFMVQKAYVDSYGVNYHEPIYSGSTEGNAVMVADTLTESFQSGNGFYELGYINDEARYSYGKKSKDGKTFYWYFSYDKDRSGSQLNSSGSVYYWVAIG